MSLSIRVKTDGPSGSGKTLALQLIEEALKSKFKNVSRSESWRDETQEDVEFTVSEIIPD